MTIPFDL